MSTEQLFTIKHVDLADRVTLWPSVSRVHFTPWADNTSAGSPPEDTVYFDMGRETVTISSGTVFVMNSAGKTIERLSLTSMPKEPARPVQPA